MGRHISFGSGADPLVCSRRPRRLGLVCMELNLFATGGSRGTRADRGSAPQGDAHWPLSTSRIHRGGCCGQRRGRLQQAGRDVRDLRLRLGEPGFFVEVRLQHIAHDGRGKLAMFAVFK